MLKKHVTELRQQIERDAAASAEASRFLVKLADRYIVDRLLGRGGMGLVYLARDAKLGRQVAIKVLHPDVASRIDSDRFWGEIRLTASLQHTHVMQVVDGGCLEGVYYCITPYVTEGSLRRLLVESGALPAEHAIGIALDVLEALEYAHERRVVHCDIKPENILLPNGCAILTDFGIARMMRRRPGPTGNEISGSPEYVSPEQAGGEVQLDGRSDLFSLACVLYEMLAGFPLFRGSTTQVVVAQRFADPVHRLEQLPSSISPEIVDSMRKALAVDPDDRYDSATEFAVDLAASLSQSRNSSSSRSAVGTRIWGRRTRV